MKICSICGYEDDEHNQIPFYDIANDVTACGMCMLLMYMWYNETRCKEDKPKCSMCGQEKEDVSKFKYLKIAGSCYCEACLALCILYTEENMLGIKRDKNRTVH